MSDVASEGVSHLRACGLRWYLKNHCYNVTKDSQKVMRSVLHTRAQRGLPLTLAIPDIQKSSQLHVGVPNFRTQAGCGTQAECARCMQSLRSTIKRQEPQRIRMGHTTAAQKRTHALHAAVHHHLFRFIDFGCNERRTTLIGVVLHEQLAVSLLDTVFAGTLTAHTKHAK